MALQVCEGCGTVYAVGLDACPHCGSVQYRYDWEEPPALAAKPVPGKSKSTAKGN